MTWHDELCPTCGASGRVLSRRQMGGTGRCQVIGHIDVPCDVCDGRGRIKIPDGWHLAGDVTGTITISGVTIMHPGEPAFSPSDTHIKTGLS